MKRMKNLFVLLLGVLLCAAALGVHIFADGSTLKSEATITVPVNQQTSKNGGTVDTPAMKAGIYKAEVTYILGGTKANDYAAKFYPGIEVNGANYSVAFEPPTTGDKIATIYIALPEGVSTLKFWEYYGTNYDFDAKPLSVVLTATKEFVQDTVVFSVGEMLNQSSSTPKADVTYWYDKTAEKYYPASSFEAKEAKNGAAEVTLDSILEGYIAHQGSASPSGFGNAYDKREGKGKAGSVYFRTTGGVKDELRFTITAPKAGTYAVYAPIGVANANGISVSIKSKAGASGIWNAAVTTTLAQTEAGVSSQTAGAQMASLGEITLAAGDNYISVTTSEAVLAGMVFEPEAPAAPELPTTPFITYTGLSLRTEQDFAGLRAVYDIDKTALAELEAANRKITFGVLAAAASKTENGAIISTGMTSNAMTVSIGDNGVITGPENTQMIIVRDDTGKNKATGIYLDTEKSQFAYTIAYFYHNQSPEYFKNAEFIFRAFYIIDGAIRYVDMSGDFAPSASIYEVANAWKDRPELQDKRAVYNILWKSEPDNYQTEMPVTAPTSKKWTTPKMVGGIYKAEMTLSSSAGSATKTDLFPGLQIENALFTAKMTNATVANTDMTATVYIVLPEGQATTLSFYEYYTKASALTVTPKTLKLTLVEAFAGDTIIFTPKADIGTTNTSYIQSGGTYYQATNCNANKASTTAVSLDSITSGYIAHVGSSADSGFGYPYIKGAGSVGGVYFRQSNAGVQDELRFTITVPTGKAGTYTLYAPVAIHSDTATVTLSHKTAAGDPYTSSSTVGMPASPMSGSANTGAQMAVLGSLTLSEGVNYISMKSGNLALSQIAFVRGAGGASHTVDILYHDEESGTQRILSRQTLYDGEDAAIPSFLPKALEGYTVLNTDKATNVTSDRALLLRRAGDTAVTLTVDPNASGAGVYQTVAEAYAAAKTHIQAGAPDVVIQLSAGVHRMNGELLLGSTDLGRRDASITFVGAQNGERSVITSTREIDLDAATQVAGKNYFVYQIPEEEKVGGEFPALRDLYFDGDMGRPANTQLYYQKDGGDENDKFFFDSCNKNVPEGIDPADRLLYVSQNELSRMDSPALDAAGNVVGTLEIWIQVEWEMHALRVEHIGTAGTYEGETLVPIRIVESDWNAFLADYYTSAGGIKGCRYFFQNNLACLDEPGEFYYDRAGGKIYFYPFAETTSVSYPTAERLFHLENAENIRFYHLTFTGTTMNFIGENGCFISGQGGSVAGANAGFLPYAALYGENTSDITVEDCVFTDVGFDALYFTGAVERVSIQSSRFTDIGASAIRFGQATKPARFDATLHNESIAVTNNYLENIGVHYNCAASILVTSVRDLEITHNTILDSAYSAVSVGWSWKDYRGYVNVENAHIDHNYIENFMTEMQDGGAIYTLGGNAPRSLETTKETAINTISHNYIVLQAGMANHTSRFTVLYHDQGSSHWYDEGNVLVSGPSGPYCYHEYASFQTISPGVHNITNSGMIFVGTDRRNGTKYAGETVNGAWSCTDTKVTANQNQYIGFRLYTDFASLGVSSEAVASTAATAGCDGYHPTPNAFSGRH